ncbi:hypothetical protein ACOYW6_01025 [Parablastomonas sp. CN1-191]|uniref:hypothetical protein n=1 Tax=Parablastomonas sp. CN1-191 TaxID=3400908 RepID=UPI003BF88C84
MEEGQQAQAGIVTAGRSLGMVVALAPALGGCSAPDGSVAALERMLAAHDSATVALEQWCTARGFAADPHITARRVAGDPPAEPARLRQRLGVSAAAPLGYRHVELSCGDRVLSVAHNWYAADRLTPEMNAALGAGDVPFGKIAAPLAFRRETLDERRGGEPGCPAGTVLSQIALLRLPSGAPLAFLTECYTRAALD